MGQLTGAALAAAKVHDWVHSAGERLVAPLGSVELLVSPSAAELATRPDLAGRRAATFDEFRAAAIEWRERCLGDKENVALFYFAGHGAQLSRDDVALLMRDFADDAGDPLRHAVDLNGMVKGMAPSPDGPDVPATQLWFVDACRALPAEFRQFEDLSAGKIFPVYLSSPDYRCAPIYFAALPGTSAYGIAGEGTVFGEALIECLEGAAGQRLGNQPWKVTTGTLLGGLKAVIEHRYADSGQLVWCGGQVTDNDQAIVELVGTPQVHVSIELCPTERAGEVCLCVNGPDGPVDVPSPLVPNPFVDRWPAGIYEFASDPEHPAVRREPLPVLPPVFPWRTEIDP